LKCNMNFDHEGESIPEMDDFKWVTFSEAKEILHHTQVEAIRNLEKLMDNIIDKSIP